MRCDLDAAEIEQGLSRHFGSERVSDVRPLGSGFETDVVAFSLRSPSPEPRDLILRLYAGSGAPEKAAREFGVMQRLYHAGYPVPRVTVLAHEQSPFGRPFVVMERIEGVALEWSPPEERRRRAQILHMRLMADLHLLDGAAVLPDSPLARTRDPYAFVEFELGFQAKLLAALAKQAPRSLELTLLWLRARRWSVPCDRLSVIHGDFHRNNILVRQDGSAVVIDWSNARLADARMDLAWTRLLQELRSRPDGGAEEMALYEGHSGGAVREIEYFDCLASMRLLLSVLNSLHFGAATQGMRPEAEDSMRRDAGFMRYPAALLQDHTGIDMADLDDAFAAAVSSSCERSGG